MAGYSAPECRYKDECRTAGCRYWHPRDGKGKGKGKAGAKCDLFKSIDKDGDGVITCAEIDRAVRDGVLGAGRKSVDGDVKGGSKGLCKWGASCRNKDTCPYVHPHKLDLTTPRLILASDNIDGHELLLRALHDHIVCVSVKWDSWTLDDLEKAIRKVAGNPNHQYASVAFMDHGDEGYFQLLRRLGGPVNMTRLKSNADLVKFFLFIKDYVRAPARLDRPELDLSARIDLFSCNTGAGREGKELLQFLEKLTRVNWAASTNKTGKDGKYFDYAMETETHLGLPPIHPCYWDETRLRKFEGTLLVICACVGTATILAAAIGAGGHVAGKALDKALPDAK